MLQSQALIRRAGQLVLEPYTPPVKRGHVKVRMLAAAIHPADRLSIEGKYPVKDKEGVAGNEGVGVVTDVAEAPGAKLQVGDRVIPMQSDIGGVWCNKQSFPELQLYPIPPSMPSAAAATIRINPGTALRLLLDYTREGDTVIQSGGNGQVGRAVAELGGHFKRRIVSLVRGGKAVDAKGDLVCGYPECTKELLLERFGQLPRVAFDCVGGDVSRQLLSLLQPGGTLISYGGISGDPVTVSVSDLIFRGKQVRGFWVSEWFRRAKDMVIRGMLDVLCDLHGQGILTTPDLQETKFPDWAGATTNSHVFVFDP